MGLVSHMLLKISKGDDTDAYNNNWSYVDNKPSNREPKIDIQKLNQELHEMAELTTVEKTYYYSMTYEDGKVPLLTKHRFSMNYCVKRDVIASNAVVKRQHADYVRYGWRKNRYCPVPCWPPALTESML